MESEAITSKLQRVLTSVDASEVENALVEAKEAGLTETVDYQSLELYSAKLSSQLALKEAMEKALEDEDLEQLKACLALVKQNGFDKNPESWLPGVNGEYLAGQVFITMEKQKEKKKVEGMRQEQQDARQASFKDIKASQNRIEESQVKVSNETDEEKATKALQEDAAKLASQTALKKAMEEALEDEDLEQLKTCLALVKENKLDKNPESWLPGLNGAALASQVFYTVEQLKEKMKVAFMRQEQEAKVQATLFKKKSQSFEPSFQSVKDKSEEVDEDKNNCFVELEQAAAEYDVGRMKELIGQGSNLGMSDTQLGNFRALYEQLKTEDFLQSRISRCEESLRKDDVEEVVFKQLRNLAYQLARLTGDELYWEDAMETIRAAESKDEGDAMDEENELPLEFYQLGNFPKLKKYFCGHRGSLFARLSRKSGKGDMEKMVSHSYDALQEGLTVLPVEQEHYAVKSFGAILEWMGDKPVTTARRLSASYDIVAIANVLDPLKDEVYCQVMKQLTNNPSQGSILLGWKLLLLFCQEVSPSEDLYKFIRYFIISNLRELRKAGGELLVIARQCLRNINKQSCRAEEDKEENNKVEEEEPCDEVMRKNSLSSKKELSKNEGASQEGVDCFNEDENPKKAAIANKKDDLDGTYEPISGTTMTITIVGFELKFSNGSVHRITEKTTTSIRADGIDGIYKFESGILTSERFKWKKVGYEAVDMEDSKIDTTGDNTASVGDETLETSRTVDAKGASKPGAFPSKAPADEEGLIDVVVILLDYSTRKIRLHESSNLISLGQAVAMQMRLEKFQDFSFFHLMVGSNDPVDVQRCVGSTFKGELLEVQRLLPMKSVVKTLLKKWEGLKRMSGKDSYFLFKRGFIDKDEELRSWDMPHANLTFRQTIWDYLHLPICESREMVIQTAVALLSTDREEFHNALKDKDISGKGVLEQVVPEHFLKYHTDRSRLSKEILQRLNRQDVDHLTRHSKMSRFVELCQSMKMFGCQYWHVEQCAAPGNQKAVERLPESSLAVNPKAPFGEYWIVVSTANVSFLPFDGAPGEEILRSFGFSSTSRDQLVHWGYRQDLLQLVVKTVDPANVAGGQVEFSMSFRSRGALDCAFALQVAKGSFQESV